MRTRLLPLAVLLLAACGQPSGQPDAASGASSPASLAQPAATSPALATTSHDFFRQKRCVQKDDYCAETSLTLPDTGQAWLDQLLKQKLYLRYSTENILIQNDEELRQAYQQIQNDLYEGVQFYAEEKSALGQYNNHTDQVHFLYQRGHTAVFEVSHDDYTGGAHSQYLMVDLSKQQALSLQDIIRPGQQSKLQERLKEAYDQYQQQCNCLTGKPELTDNFLFSADGIEFRYPPYEIAGFAYGEINLVVSWNWLEDIVKPEYLWKPPQPSSKL
ncbi:RsiV family protein [Eikenella sp. Marseille-P7795]|uniref:RsiV family protein n=1 Tax=Eikenella sp. Marseille-P7795 TaxID=2866577 RepID=UPI001CE3D5BC|nr:RsiV family protein [Eikenella sp. Marseille-P7795]